MNRVRIIGGIHRSRYIEFPDATGLRPTPDRVRETLFNWLGQDLYGLRCLDLFAGSGALGFEAASRGAGQVVMVEKNRQVFQSLTANVAKLRLENVALHCTDGLEFARRESGPYDVVFLDPPFQSELLPQALALLKPRLTETGRAYVESGAAFAPLPGWQAEKSGRAGQVHYQLLRRDD
ncbi:MAG: 16S rRNA (guanine(966)-N(2))-methyltransferase RsmD [Nitrosomonadales bacterium]|nr:16S rRNA (guanine(966)-N(2))-methyltransferase RsmD [Nitrosomonadales bacterium]